MQCAEHYSTNSESSVWVRCSINDTIVHKNIRTMYKQQAPLYTLSLHRKNCWYEKIRNLGILDASEAPSTCGAYQTGAQRFYHHSIPYVYLRTSQRAQATAQKRPVSIHGPLAGRIVGCAGLLGGGREKCVPCCANRRVFIRRGVKNFSCGARRFFLLGLVWGHRYL